MRVLIVLAAICCLCVLAVIAGSRLALASRMLLAGVAIGVTASIPAALVAIVASRHYRTPPMPDAPEPHYRPAPTPPPQPAVVIVSPQRAARMVRYPLADPTLPAPPRTFTMRGEEGHK